MNDKPVLYFFCGKMAAGKSTLARRLAKDNDAILLVEDEWLIRLYPDEIVDISAYLNYSRRLKECIEGHVIALLAKGISVVLDFPANTMDQRAWFRRIFESSNVAHQLHFLDMSDERCKQQLQERSKSKPEGAAFTSDAEFDAITKYFQAPVDDENFNIIEYERS